MNFEILGEISDVETSHQAEACTSNVISSELTMAISIPHQCSLQSS